MDVFGREIRYRGGFKGEDAVITITGASDVGSLVRSLQFGYRQGISRIWDLTDGSCFFVAGRTEGSWSVARVVGPGSFMDALREMTVCTPGTISFGSAGGFCGSGVSVRRTNYTLKNTVLTGISSSVNSDDMILNEGVSGIFLSLEIT